MRGWISGSPKATLQAATKCPPVSQPAPILSSDAFQNRNNVNTVQMGEDMRCWKVNMLVICLFVLLKTRYFSIGAYEDSSTL